MNTSPPPDTVNRILLVDHDMSLREVIEQTLNSDGLVTLSAANRHQALELLQQQSVDLVIIDMLMPGAESIGTIIAIQAFNPHIKLIAVSSGPAGAAAKFLPLAKSLGANVLLSDPLDRGKLLDAVHGLLSPALRQVAC